MDEGAPLARIAMRAMVKTIDLLVSNAGEVLTLEDRRLVYELRRRMIDRLAESIERAG